MKTILSALIILTAGVAFAGPQADYSKAHGLATARANQAEAQTQAQVAKQNQQATEETRQSRIAESVALLKRQGVAVTTGQVVDGGRSYSESTYGGPGSIDLGADQYFASNGEVACRIEFSVQSLPGMGTSFFPPTSECLAIH